MSAAARSEIERRGDRGIQIVWDDGHASVYADPDPRFECSCALRFDE